LIQQIIKITINYSKFETIIEIDIEKRTKLSVIPAYSIGLEKYEMETDLILGNSSDSWDNYDMINEIFDRNHTRKSLFRKFQNQELGQFLSLRAGNKKLNLSSVSKSYNSFLIPSKVNDFYILLSTFILDINVHELKIGRKEREIFTILFDFKIYKKSRKGFIRNSLNFFIHSQSIETIKQTEIFKPINGLKSYILSLRGIKQTNIEYGKEICSHYKSNDRPFDAFSQSVCLRKCYQNCCQKRFKFIKDIITDG
jgi:hypothetical protein